MTGTEEFLVGIVIGLLGLGGGIWTGGRGKVREADCVERHSGLADDRKEIKEAIQTGFRDIRDQIKEQFCTLQAEDKIIHSRLTEHESRLSRMEGGKQ